MRTVGSLNRRLIGVGVLDVVLAAAWNALRRLSLLLSRNHTIVPSTIRSPKTLLLLVLLVLLLELLIDMWRNLRGGLLRELIGSLRSLWERLLKLALREVGWIGRRLAGRLRHRIPIASVDLLRRVVSGVLDVHHGRS